MTTLTMRRIRNVFETSALMRVMSAMLATQFESFAECCLELAQVAETPTRRARLVQMAREYRRATRLMSTQRRSETIGAYSDHPPRRSAASPAAERHDRPRVHRAVLDGVETTRWIAELDVCLTDALLQSRPED